ncbi:MAG: hypothetical protein HQL12_05200 [Candidatus Omnitrophica bacterium]|nr:hypothetical protein [Candidatus Omnitrophota bacterium]
MNKRGQSIIEYCLIIILVILGVVFMGPYVLRSVNAHFKLWDEGTRDSFEEHLKQAPINVVPPITTNCVCTHSTNACHGAYCGPTQDEIDTTCTPTGCDALQSTQPSCVPDPACCTSWAYVGCGSSPLGQALQANNCYYGTPIYQHQCGSNNTVFCGCPPATACPPNTCPQPQCTGFVTFLNSTTFCKTGNSTPPSNPPINQDTNYNFVTDNVHCTGGWCDAYCNPPYSLNSAQNACELRFTVAAIMNGCGSPPSTNFSAPTCSTKGCCPSTSSCTEGYCNPVGVGGGWVTTTNDQSFTICANPPIKSAVVVGSGCQNPGTPSMSCGISITYGCTAPGDPACS